MRKFYAVQKMEAEKAEYTQETLLDMPADFKPVDLTPWEDIAKMDNEAFNNSELLIAEGCSYSLNDMKTRLNNNVLVVGGSGTGKTRTIVTPNLYQAVGSYIVSDPKGSLQKKYGRYLKSKGYRIRSIDFTHPDRSAHYNPMKMVSTTQDIIRITDVLVNEKASHGTSADPFWDSMTTIFLSAVIGYLVETNDKSMNFSTILNLVRMGDRREEDSKESELAEKFRQLRMKNPDSWACAQFDNVDASPDRTYDCIRATLAAKFAKFDSKELQIMMSSNDFDFASVAQQKTVVFVTVSDTDRSMDALANIFFTQAMQALCDYADNFFEDSRLPIPVRFILDDFASNCKIEEFPRMISTIRSRGISVMLMIQSEAQLRQGYGFDDMTIISNCDTYVYLGGNDVDTAQSVSLRCDKMLRQVLYMPVGACWVFRRGSQPVYTKLLDTRECIYEMEMCA